MHTERILYPLEFKTSVKLINTENVVCKLWAGRQFEKAEFHIYLVAGKIILTSLKEESTEIEKFQKQCEGHNLTYCWTGHWDLSSNLMLSLECYVQVTAWAQQIIGLHLIHAFQNMHCMVVYLYVVELLINTKSIFILMTA